MTIPPPALHPAFYLTVHIGEPLEQGRVDGLVRRIIPITGGTVTGPRLRGVVLPGGADWQTIRPDGVADIYARYTIQAEDGALIGIENPGLRHGPPEVLARIAAGETVDPASYYFRTAPRFTVAEGSHGWLSRTMFVATAARYADRVELAVFEIG